MQAFAASRTGRRDAGVESNNWHATWQYYRCVLYSAACLRILAVSVGWLMKSHKLDFLGVQMCWGGDSMTQSTVREVPLTHGCQCVILCSVCVCVWVFVRVSVCMCLCVCFCVWVCGCVCLCVCVSDLEALCGCVCPCLCFCLCVGLNASIWSFRGMCFFLLQVECNLLPQVMQQAILASNLWWVSWTLLRPNYLPPWHLLFLVC